MKSDQHTVSLRTFPKVRALCLLLSVVVISSCYGPVEFPDKVTTPKGSPHRLDKWLNATIENNRRGDMIDPQAELSREDYYDLFYDREAKANKVEKDEVPAVPALPNIRDLMVAPELPAVADDKLVTLMVTDDIPVKDVLVELARRADIDMEVDPAIQGGIILSAKEKPFSQVIERVARLANLRYSFEDGILKVERDLPYIRNYKMNLLNATRTSSGGIDATSTLGSGGGDGATTGSNFTIVQESGEGDIWANIELAVGNLLSQYILSSGDEDSSDPQGGIISVNRGAGVMSVLATGRQHKVIETYLNEVHRSYTSQVLIEAKVLEVTLGDEYRSGIDWSFLNNNVTGLTAGGNFSDITGLGAEAVNNTFTIGVLPTQLFGLNNTSIDASIELVEAFGVSRTLSSPRISTMNNQHAILSFAENRVYFELTVEQETVDGETITTIDSSPQTIPIGVVLSILPSIDLEREEIIMNIHPTLSRSSADVTDPGVELNAAAFGADVTSTVPVVDIRELDTVMRIKSGQVMVIGGLMEEIYQDQDRGVPKLAKIPFIGNAFKSSTKVSSIVETVIFIKATIIPGEGVSVEDRKFYNEFSVDRHDLKL